MKIPALLLLLLLPGLAFAQGPLAPPTAADPAVGPVPPLSGTAVQPTMKTLFQVEPRTPVQSLAATAPYTITAPGSYYLTSNITVASGDAIVISSDNVTLDLNGFTISCTATGTAGYAVLINGSHSRITIRNGIITSGTAITGTGSPTAVGFIKGIYSTGTLSQALVSDMHITGIGGHGVYLDRSGIIERCTAADCSGEGFQADEIHDCTAVRCYSHAIYANAHAIRCTGSAVNGYGVLSNADATDCNGTSASATGLLVSNNATGCTGVSTSTASSATVGADGLIAGNALNCSGTSSCRYGLQTLGNAMNCSGKSTGAAAPATGLYAYGNVTNCQGTSSNATGIQTGGNATGCIGTTVAISGSSDGLLVSGTATNCTGYAYAAGNSGNAIEASIAENCTGTATTGKGVYADTITGCYGTVTTGFGIYAYSTATNCHGVAGGNGTGIFTINATNCIGKTSGTAATNYGINCTGTATGSTGISGGSSSIALKAAIAIGCTYTGTLAVPTGKTFNM